MFSVKNFIGAFAAHQGHRPSLTFRYGSSVSNPDFSLKQIGTFSIGDLQLTLPLLHFVSSAPRFWHCVRRYTLSFGSVGIP
jgi:hypothetical protein